jgi:hypothetical protein
LIVLRRARPVAIGVDDTEESEPAFRNGAQLMRCVGRNIDNIEGPKLVLKVAHLNVAAPTRTDNDVTMAMAFETCEAARLKLEVSHMEIDRFTIFAD